MEGGICYVYFIYGNYFCVNTVTGKEGEGSGVLIRAIEPVLGEDKMRENRGETKNSYDLSNGPGKLCMAMDIDRGLNRTNITKINPLFVSKHFKKEKFDIAVSKRIGIGSEISAEFPYRFFINDNPYVTKHKFNKQIIEIL
jgi:DNA-3-methyladenine glycosylase